MNPDDCPNCGAGAVARDPHTNACAVCEARQRNIANITDPEARARMQGTRPHSLWDFQRIQDRCDSMRRLHEIMQLRTILNNLPSWEAI